jgi:hypothetical protein
LLESSFEPRLDPAGFFFVRGGFAAPIRQGIPQMRQFPDLETRAPDYICNCE